VVAVPETVAVPATDPSAVPTRPAPVVPAKIVAAADTDTAVTTVAAFVV
jgi:hypothetical protein